MVGGGGSREGEVSLGGRGRPLRLEVRLDGTCAWRKCVFGGAWGGRRGRSVAVRLMGLRGVSERGCEQDEDRRFLVSWACVDGSVYLAPSCVGKPYELEQQ